MGVTTIYIDRKVNKKYYLLIYNSVFKYYVDQMLSYDLLPLQIGGHARGKWDPDNGQY